MGSTDETSLRTFASAMQALALSDPGNRLAIINWAKRIYTGRLMAMPSSGNDGINLQSVINWVAQIRTSSACSGTRPASQRQSWSVASTDRWTNARRTFQAGRRQHGTRKMITERRLDFQVQSFLFIGTDRVALSFEGSPNTASHAG